MHGKVRYICFQIHLHCLEDKWCGIMSNRDSNADSEHSPEAQEDPNNSFDEDKFVADIIESKRKHKVFCG